jgi:hypothetical protein
MSGKYRPMIGVGYRSSETNCLQRNELKARAIDVGFPEIGQY